jgi:hypothetical protein
MCEKVITRHIVHTPRKHKGTPMETLPKSSKLKTANLMSLNNVKTAKKWPMEQKWFMDDFYAETVR